MLPAQQRQRADGLCVPLLGLVHRLYPIFKCPHASLRESPVVEVKAYRCQGLVGVGLLQAFMFIFVALWFVFLASSLLSSLLVGEGALLS